MSQNPLTDLIIDGNNMAHRANFIPATPVIVNGVNVTLIRHFVRMVMSAANAVNQLGDIYIVWDKRLNKDAPNFRKAMIDSEYKQNRDHSKHDHIFEMIDKAIPIMSSMGIRNVFPYALEGDDVMAWLARHHCKKSTIVTMDEDLWQLIDKNITVSNPKKGIITTDNFEAVCPVPLCKYVLYKCILGDTSDFVKGLEGYGKVKAPKLAINYDTTTLDPDQISTIERNRQLLDLEHGLSVSPLDVKAYQSQVAYHDKNTTFNKDKYMALVVDLGLNDMADPKMISAIERLSKSKQMINIFSGCSQLLDL